MAVTYVSSLMGKYFDAPKMVWMFFDSAAYMNTNKWILLILMVPADIGLQIANNPTNLWELYDKLCTYEECKDERVK